MNRKIWRPTPWTGFLARPHNAEEAVTVSIDVVALDLVNSKSIALPIKDGQGILLQGSVVTKPESGAVVWEGKAAGDDRSIATFSLVGRALVGDVVLSDGRMYRIDHVSGDVHAIFRLRPGGFLPEGVLRHLPPPKSVWLAVAGRPVRGLARSCPVDPADRIDVMVAYTDAACAGARNNVACVQPQDHNAIRAKIYQMVSETNQTYLNSQVNHRLALVHMRHVAGYLETDINSDLSRLRIADEATAAALGETLIPELSVLHDLRTTHAADVVVLITKPTSAYPACVGGVPVEGAPVGACPTSCGLTGDMLIGAPITSENAFSVVPLDCATGNLSFGHEIGHVLGANHEFDASVQPRAFPWSHGFVRPTPTMPGVAPWRTLMASSAECPATGGSAGCIRLPYWSNPGLQHGGEAMGVPNVAENYRALNDTASLVANYFPSSVCGDDVWMKDTWEDSGAQPDPAQAGMPMWQSPHIWVRAFRDTQHLHAHQHQWILARSNAWAYVRLLNGGTATQGTLELRHAPVSVDPGPVDSWPLVGSKPLALSANSAQTIEFQWLDVPSERQNLVARWISPDDPMAVASSTPLGSYVEGNNNVVWRSTAFVNLRELLGFREFIYLNNASAEVKFLSLMVRFPFLPKVRPLTYSDIVLEMDDAVAALWDKQSAKNPGFIRSGKTFRLGSQNGGAIADLAIPPGFKGKIALTFRRSGAGEIPRQRYAVEVLHGLSDKQGVQTISGATTYEVTTRVEDAKAASSPPK